MGLDIYFHKAKRTDYKAYTEAHEKWEKDQPASSKISNAEYEKLPKTEQEKISKEVGEWYKKEPNMAKSGISDIGYFRKVNFLMTFFSYTGNCEFKEIAKCQLEDLVERCKEVLKTKKGRRERAEDLLPTQSGFFFGNTEYTEYYYQDVKEVQEWAEGVLADLKDDEMVLMYCWW